MGREHVQNNPPQLDHQLVVDDVVALRAENIPGSPGSVAFGLGFKMKGLGFKV